MKGKHVTSFTNGEEEEVQMTHVVPFLVEDELRRLGAIYEEVADWQPFQSYGLIFYRRESRVLNVCSS